MTSWESLVIIALVSVVGAKLYTAWKGKTGRASTAEPANLATSEPNPPESTLADGEMVEDNAESTTAWEEGYLILIALLLCGPLGLILMWRADRWNSNTKMKLTAVYLAIVLLIAGLGISSC